MEASPLQYPPTVEQLIIPQDHYCPLSMLNLFKTVGDHS